MRFLVGLILLAFILSACSSMEFHAGFGKVSGGGEGLPGLLAAGASKQVFEASVQNNDCAVSEKWTQGAVLRPRYYEVAEDGGFTLRMSAGSQQPTYLSGTRYYTTHVVPATPESTVPFRPSASSYFQFDGQTVPCPGAIR